MFDALRRRIVGWIMPKMSKDRCVYVIEAPYVSMFNVTLEDAKRYVEQYSNDGFYPRATYREMTADEIRRYAGESRQT